MRRKDFAIVTVTTLPDQFLGILELDFFLVQMGQPLVGIGCNNNVSCACVGHGQHVAGFEIEENGSLFVCGLVEVSDVSDIIVYDVIKQSIKQSTRGNKQLASNNKSKLKLTSCKYGKSHISGTMVSIPALSTFCMGSDFPG